MHRRTFLSTLSLGTVGLAGCLGGDAGGGFGASTPSEEPDTNDTETAYPGLSLVQRSFITTLDETLDVLSASVTSDALLVVVQTSGQRETDRQVVAEVYANYVGRLESDLRVRIEDRGIDQAAFVIRTEWAEAFVNGEIDANEYLNRIDETVTT